MTRKKRASMKHKPYTATQENNILRTLSRAKNTSRKKGSVSKALTSLAKKYCRTPRAIEAKYGRLTGDWAP